MMSAQCTCRAVRVAVKPSTPESAAAAAVAAEAGTDALNRPSTPPHVAVPQMEEAGEGWEYDYVPHPEFPDLPSAVPLTFTLTMHACLSLTPSERPSFRQVRLPLQA